MEGVFAKKQDRSVKIKDRYTLPNKAQGDSKSKATVATLNSVIMLNQLNQNNKRALPMAASVDFVPQYLRKAVTPQKKHIDRHAWECALYLKVRDELKQGNINCDRSKRFSSLKGFFIPHDEMKLITKDFFKRAKFPENPDQMRKYFTDRLAMAYEKYFSHEPENNYAKVVNGKWELTSDSTDGWKCKIVSVSEI